MCRCGHRPEPSHLRGLFATRLPVSLNVLLAQQIGSYSNALHCHQSRIAPFDIDGGSRALRDLACGSMPVRWVGLHRPILLCGFTERQKLLGES
jgi:hypothetical protein